MNSILDKSEQALWDEFTHPNKYGSSSTYDIFIGRLKEELDRLATDTEATADVVYFPWLLDLSIFHFEYSIYAKYKLKDDKIFKEHLALSNEYGFLCLEFGSQSCNCFEDRSPFIIMNKAVFMMSNLLLAGQDKKFENIANHLINSLNGDGCIIKKGYAKANISWFVLKLYSLYANKKITLHKLLQPKEDFPYDEVLENWDTQDKKQVEKFIYILCDAHIAQADLDEANYEEREYDDLSYLELFMPALYTFPFEVLVWLKLREKHGLKNPTKFTHPLMNTPTAKFFLELNTPLPKSKELPYVKEILERLKEKCSDIKTRAFD